MTLLWYGEYDALNRKVLENAAHYDAVIYCGGRTHAQDKEAIGIGDVPGADIGSWSLPDEQDDFIRALCEANPHVIGVFNTAGPFDLCDWREKMAAILIDWYPGMEGGNALADLLLGNVEPEGRLPFTWGETLMDYACHANGAYPGVRSGDYPHTCYTEGELIGYRKITLEPRARDQVFFVLDAAQVETLKRSGFTGLLTGTDALHLPFFFSLRTF